MSSEEGLVLDPASASVRALGLADTQPAEARSLAESVLSLGDNGADPASRARSLYVIGIAHLSAKSYERAETELRRALDLAQETGDKTLIVQIQRALLKGAFFTRNLEAALLRGLRALQTARAIDDPVLEADTRNDLGLVYGELGDFEGALEHLLAGLRLMRNAGSTKLSRLLNNIGNVYYGLGDHREALGFFESALDAFRTEESSRGEGIALGNVGRAKMALRKIEDAVESLRHSVRIFTESNDDLYLAPALARLGTALASLDLHDEAETAFRSARDLVDRSPVKEFQEEILLASSRYDITHGRVDEGVRTLAILSDVIPEGEITRRAYELHALLAEACERCGDTPAALGHFKNYQRVRQAVSDAANAVRIRGLMLQFDVEQARQQAEIFRLRNIELARANEELQLLHTQLEERNRLLEQISVEDALTGLQNRRYLALQLGVEVRKALRHDRALCVAMCDLDHFKAINDRFSHAIGDEVLRRVGAIFRAEIRVTDVATRYGGEEFIVLLPDTDLGGAAALAERLREGVADHPWSELVNGLSVTVSIGVAQLSPGGNPESLLADADARLYQAKHAGRNRVISE